MKMSEPNKNVRIANRRKIYDFAESNHSDKPAEIEVGKPILQVMKIQN